MVYKGYCLTAVLKPKLWTYLLMASSETEVFTDKKDSQQIILSFCGLLDSHLIKILTGKKQIFLEDWHHESISVNGFGKLKDAKTISLCMPITPRMKRVNVKMIKNPQLYSDIIYPSLLVKFLNVYMLHYYIL